MYSHVPAVEAAIRAASRPEGVVLTDRRKYEPFFRAAEEYAHARGLVVGGATATLLLLGNPPGPMDYFYELYSTAAQADARALTKVLYDLAPEGLAHYAVMTPRVPWREYEIAVDERPLFLIRDLSDNTNRDGAAELVFTPSVRPAFFARHASGAPLPLLCLGPEIQLIGVYAALSDPSRAGSWGGLLTEEERLRALFVASGGAAGPLLVAGRRRRAAGGGGRGGGRTPAAGPAEEGGAPGGAAPLLAAILNEYAARPGRVLVGAFAVQRALFQTGGAPPAPPRRLQVVSAHAFPEEERAVGRIAKRLGYAVGSALHEPKIPADDRLRRLTVYVCTPQGRREALLDIYNTGALVAYTNAPAVPGEERGVPVGAPFTLLRFLLVDVWTIQRLARLDKITRESALLILRGAYADFQAVVSAYLEDRVKGEVSKIFPKTYVGAFSDPVILAKRERRSGGRPPEGQQQRRRPAFCPPYFPAAAARTGPALP